MFLDLVMFVMPTVTDAGQLEEHQGQHHKHERLHDTYQNFQHIKWYWDEERNQERHGRQYDFTCKDIAK
jgi:hypothetical protein